MNDFSATIAEQLAAIAASLQQKRTGHAPQAVSVVLSKDTLVVTLLDALAPAEKALARTAAGAAQVQEFHRQLFANSTSEMRQEILRLTGRVVKEAAAEIEPATGMVLHAFTTGDMVQVFLLKPQARRGDITQSDAIERAEDDGLKAKPDDKTTKRADK